MPRSKKCPECGEVWPRLFLDKIPLTGCPECNPEGFRAFPSGESHEDAVAGEETVPVEP